MPAPHPPEFRCRAIDLARQPGARVGQAAKDLGRRRRPQPAVHQDLVQRRFIASAPDRLWCTDITELAHLVLRSFVRDVAGNARRSAAPSHVPAPWPLGGRHSSSTG